MSLLNIKLLEDTSRFKKLLDNYFELTKLKEELHLTKYVVEEFNIQITPLSPTKYFSHLPVTSILANITYTDILDGLLSHLKIELVTLKDKIKKDYGSIKIDIEEEFNKLKL